MWTHADLTHWEVLGAGLEHPFVPSLLCGMSQPSAGAGWGCGAEGEGSSSVAIFFWKENVLLAVTLGEEPGGRFLKHPYVLHFVNICGVSGPQLPGDKPWEAT